MTEQSASTANRPSTKPTYWMIYIAALFGGLILLADALGFAPMQRVTGKLAIGLIYSAFVLMTGKGKNVSVAAAVLIWAAIIATFVW